MTTVTRMTSSQEINEARDAFESFVTPKVYNESFSAIGQAFRLQSMIGKKSWVYVKCVKDGQVTGLAYGHPYEGSDSTFFIADIISAPGSHSGSAMVDWFADKDNVGMPNLRTLALDAANQALRKVYASKWYGFELVNEQSSRMERSVA